MAQVSSHGEPSVMGTQQIPLDIICILSGGIEFSLKEQANFNEAERANACI